MRAMVIDYPDDVNCLHLDRQYMLGDDLLVAPVFSPDGVVSFYIPDGDGYWTDWFTGARMAPGHRHSLKVPYDRIPLLARPGSIVPLGAHDDGPEYEWADGATFRVFEPHDGSRCEILDASGLLAVALDVSTIDGGFEFRFSGPSARSESACGKMRIAIANMAPTHVEGAKLSQDGFFAVCSGCKETVRVYCQEAIAPMMA